MSLLDSPEAPPAALPVIFISRDLPEKSYPSMLIPLSWAM